MKRLLIPKQPRHLEDEKAVCLEKSMSTGILDWQELGHLDFKDLISQTRERNFYSEELDD